MLEVLMNFGGLGVMAVFAAWLLKSSISNMKDLLQMQKDLAAMISNHLMHLLSAQEQMIKAQEAQTVALKEFGTAFLQHLREFDQHRGKSEK